MVIQGRAAPFVAAMLAMALLPGCAAPGATVLRIGEPHAAKAAVFWPAPPEIPRYLYAGQLIGEVNFATEKRTGGEGFFAALRWIAGLVTGDRPPFGLLRPQSGATSADGRILVSDPIKGLWRVQGDVIPRVREITYSNTAARLRLDSRPGKIYVLEYTRANDLKSRAGWLPGRILELTVKK